MIITARLLLQKPDPNPLTGDFLDVSVLNSNFDKIDAALGAEPVTSSTRPVGAAAWDGKFIRETDTRRVYVRNNIQGVWDQLAIASAVVKTGNETLPFSTTAMQDDDHLFLSVDANSTYLLDGDIIYYAAVGADLQAGWSLPAGASMEWAGNSPSASHTGTPSFEGDVKFESRNVTQTQAWGGTGTIVHAAPRGCVQTSGTSGTLRFRWAQQTSLADSNVVYAKSWIRLQKVA